MGLIWIWSSILIENLSVDGLHPDAEGKKIIGEAVADWLDKYLNLK